MTGDSSVAGIPRGALRVDDLERYDAVEGPFVACVEPERGLVVVRRERAVAELGFIHLSHELQVASAPIILPIQRPAQQSPLRVVATEDGLLAVWSARGFPEDAPLGPNDGDLIHVARLYCE